MVLRCSLLGHDYGEPEVDREREERGSEVVLTVQTYEECARCSDRHIISENTEITSLTPDERREGDGVDRVGETTSPSEAAGDDPGSRRGPERVGGPNAETSAEGERDWPRTGVDTAADRSDEPPGESGGTDPTDADRSPDPPPNGGDVAPGADTDGGTHSGEANAGSGPEPAGTRSDPGEPDTTEPAGSPADRNVPTDDDGDPIEDGEILESGRKPGEWPDSDDVGPPTGEGSRERWPGVDIDRIGDEELTYEEPSEEESEVADDEAGSASTATDSGTGIASAASAPVPGENPVVEPVETEFYCPTCSFVAPGDHGSLRPGDICPDCGRGYIGERERK